MDTLAAPAIPYASMPGPKGVPVLGNLVEIKRQKMAFFARCSREYGDVAKVRFGGWPGMLLSNPDDIGGVLVDKSRNFVKNRFFWRQVGAIFGSGLIVNEGDFWVRQRRLASPAFAPKRVAAYAGAVTRPTERMAETFTDGEVRDVQEDMMLLALRVIVKTLFDAEESEEVDELGRAVAALNHEIAARFARPFVIHDAIPIPGNLRYRRALATIDGFVARRVAERRADPGDRGDFLSIMLQASDDQGAPLPDRLVRDEAVTMLLAGHETTALVLSWAIDFLSRHPEEAERISSSAIAVLGDRTATAEDVAALSDVEALVSETMRLRPPGWIFGRQAIADCTIAGYEVPAGTSIYVSPWLLHRDPRFYDAPEEFRPTRWTPDFVRDLPRFAYLPFSGGQRVCIGKGFATMESVLILSTLLRRWRFESAGAPERGLIPSITLRPVGGVPVRLRRRTG